MFLYETNPSPAGDHYGMLEGSKGIVYLTAIEENAIALFDPHSQKTMIVVQDKRLQWPDHGVGAGWQALRHDVADSPDAQVPWRREQAAGALHGLSDEVAMRPASG
jgi:hypothetical protein